MSIDQEVAQGKWPTCPGAADGVPVPAALAQAGVTLPEAFLHADSMARLAKAAARQEGLPVCALPFCHTLEAESLGARVRLGATGLPRCGEPVLAGVAEVMGLPAARLGSGRVAETLEACELLADLGLPVMFRLTGPLSVVGALMGSGAALRALRREPQEALSALRRVAQESLSLARAALERGAALLSVADTSCNPALLGPATVDLVAREVLADYLGRLAGLVRGRASVVVCPQVRTALVRAGCLRARPLDLCVSGAAAGRSTCAEAFVRLAGKHAVLSAGCLEGPGLAAPARQMWSCEAVVSSAAAGSQREEGLA